MPLQYVFRAGLLIAFGALQIADVITTKQVLDKGGWEGNPIQAFTMSLLGGYWPLPKLALMVACMAFMVRWQAKYVAPFVLLMGVVVGNNAIWAYG